jgi:hypothetical protein
VFCIAVRETQSAEFDAIASEPDHVYLHSLKDYDALTEITNIIAAQTWSARRDGEGEEVGHEWGEGRDGGVRMEGVDG